MKGLIIAERFSGLHHAVQIVRECGVAFVYLPETAAESIPDGAAVYVDGKEGRVTLIEKVKDQE